MSSTRWNSHQRWSDLKSFVRGGYWRNFKTKYDETNEMYARMMHVSRRLAEAETSGVDAGELAEIRDHLYRGQCNCPYWHGAFGGIYLPHLRNAVYHHLDRSRYASRSRHRESIRARFKRRPTITTSTVCKKSGSATIGSARGSRRDSGGRMYELDVRDIGHNLLATLQRRPESYHRKVLTGPSADR